jgi:D-alanine-D-alanine ligase
VRIAVLHNSVRDGSAPDEADVLIQAAAVTDALNELGHEAFDVPCGLNLAMVRDRLTALGPNRVFNLVESLDGHGSLIHLVPYLLDALGTPYTGARAEAMLATSNKIMAKFRLRAGGLDTPDWVGPYPEAGTDGVESGNLEGGPGMWIVKSVWEHASIGLDAAGLLRDRRPGDLWPELARRASGLGGSCFAEAFVDGREFNLAVLAGPAGPEVLPPAEIVFEGYGPDRPRIVDYRAKWDADSFEYTHTPRRFEFPETERLLLKRLTETALAAWRCFGLAGYARVDFRVDDGGRPWILEVNANPCLSPDAGFAAALERAGIPFAMAVDRILGDAAHVKEQAA